MASSVTEEERAYRLALGAFATGVAVVSAGDAERGFAAITINSLTSVSLTPRLILWCLDDRCARFETFAKAPAFGVTILHWEQSELAIRFARPGSQGLDSGEVEMWEGGAPVLRRGLSRLACRTHDRMTMGDHLVIVGEVLSFANELGDGLTYFRGSYGRAPGS